MGEAAETVPKTPSASTEEDLEYRTSSVSYSFRLEWKIPTKTFTDRSHTPRPLAEGLPREPLLPYTKFIENSKLFEFKNLKIHPFSLVLIQESNKNPPSYRLKLVTKEPTDGVKLEYAFVCVDERLLYLRLLDKSPLTYLEEENILRQNKLNPLKQKDIKIICGISAISNVSYSPDDPERFIMECSLPMDLPPFNHFFWPTKTSMTAHEALTEYTVSGQLPSLNVRLATYLLGLTTEEENAELKALSVEYLIKNLSAENVVGVLHAACDNHAKALVAKCKDFINKFCRVVPK